MFLTNDRVQDKLRIAKLEAAVEMEGERAAVTIANMKVQHQQDLAIHREANAKLQVEIGKLQGDIRGLKIVDERNGECPTCKNNRDQMLAFMEKLSQAIEHWTPTTPQPPAQVIIPYRGAPQTIGSLFNTSGTYTSTSTR